MGNVDGVRPSEPIPFTADIGVDGPADGIAKPGKNIGEASPADSWPSPHNNGYGPVQLALVAPAGVAAAAEDSLLQYFLQRAPKVAGVGAFGGMALASISVTILGLPYAAAGLARQERDALFQTVQEATHWPDGKVNAYLLGYYQRIDSSLSPQRRDLAGQAVAALADPEAREAKPWLFTRTGYAVPGAGRFIDARIDDAFSGKWRPASAAGRDEEPRRPINVDKDGRVLVIGLPPGLDEGDVPRAGTDPFTGRGLYRQDQVTEALTRNGLLPAAGSSSPPPPERPWFMPESASPLRRVQEISQEVFFVQSRQALLDVYWHVLGKGQIPFREEGGLARAADGCFSVELMDWGLDASGRSEGPHIIIREQIGQKTKVTKIFVEGERSPTSWREAPGLGMQLLRGAYFILMCASGVAVALEVVFLALWAYVTFFAP
jgi:hypothetical protein